MDIVNLSLSQGSIECLKNAILNPLIKELDQLIEIDILKKLQTCLKPDIRQQTH